MQEWEGRHPVVIVPTKYYSTPADKFKELGVRLVIWANHNMRASIDAMKAISQQIHREKSLVNVENKVAPIEEIIRLQRAEELRSAEKKYLPSTKRDGK